jgi:hypothetical protein
MEVLVLLPLLHVGNAVVSAGPGVIACLIVLAAAVVLGSAAGAFSRQRRRVRRRLATIACSLLVLAAVTPSVLPYDHLLTAFHAHEGAAVHASHCHDSPSSCADAPVTSGPGQILDSAPLLVIPAMVAVLLIIVTTMPVGITRRPALRPPLLLFVASS